MGKKMITIEIGEELVYVGEKELVSFLLLNQTHCLAFVCYVYSRYIIVCIGISLGLNCTRFVYTSYYDR